MLSLFFLVPTGCQYQFGYGDLSQQYATISVPYVEGDLNGDLTARVIKQLSTTGAFIYRAEGGDLTLKIKLLEIADENIGFRYNRHKDGELKKTIIPTETRAAATIELVVIESASGKILRGPTRLSASVEFDHDYYASRNEINVFSLGQLTDIDAAQEAARTPLNKELAEKVADYLLYSW